MTALSLEELEVYHGQSHPCYLLFDDVPIDGVLDLSDDIIDFSNLDFSTNLLNLNFKLNSSIDSLTWSTFLLTILLGVFSTAVLAATILTIMLLNGMLITIMVCDDPCHRAMGKLAILMGV